MQLHPACRRRCSQRQIRASVLPARTETASTMYTRTERIYRHTDPGTVHQSDVVSHRHSLAENFRLHRGSQWVGIGAAKHHTMLPLRSLAAMVLATTRLFCPCYFTSEPVSLPSRINGDKPGRRYLHGLCGSVVRIPIDTAPRLRGI